MRRDGDLLIEHLATAREQVLLCAPFIKAPVLRRLLEALRPEVHVRVVTRWRADEVAAGVSDLETLDIVEARPNTTLALLDPLHAKVYVADGRAIVGSANLTAKALGWCRHPNLEVLVPAPADDAGLVACLDELASARLASEEERTKIDAAVAALPPRPPSSEAGELDEARAAIWLPRLGDPRRLFPVYAGVGVDRMIRPTVDAASHDIEALGLPAGLDEAAFNAAVARAFAGMPAIARLLAEVDRDLVDDDAVRIIAELPLADRMPPDQQWLVVREWITRFMADRIEVAPQSFVTRRRPGSGR